MDKDLRTNRVIQSALFLLSSLEKTRVVHSSEVYIRDAFGHMAARCAAAGTSSWDIVQFLDLLQWMPDIHERKTILLVTGLLWLSASHLSTVVSTLGPSRRPRISTTVSPEHLKRREKVPSSTDLIMVGNDVPLDCSWFKPLVTHGTSFHVGKKIKISFT